jgi:hypothetical protein
LNGRARESFGKSKMPPAIFFEPCLYLQRNGLKLRDVNNSFLSIAGVCEFAIA